MAKVMLNKHWLGLTIGIFAAALHAVWAIVVAAGLAQSFVDFIFPLHFLNSAYSVLDFNVMTAVLLIVMAFAGGYVCGYAFAMIGNYISQKFKV